MPPKKRKNEYDGYTQSTMDDFCVTKKNKWHLSFNWESFWQVFGSWLKDRVEMIHQVFYFQKKNITTIEWNDAKNELDKWDPLSDVVMDTRKFAQDDWIPSSIVFRPLQLDILMFKNRPYTVKVVMGNDFMNPRLEENQQKDGVLGVVLETAEFIVVVSRYNPTCLDVFKLMHLITANKGFRIMETSFEWTRDNMETSYPQLPFVMWPSLQFFSDQLAILGADL